MIKMKSKYLVNILLKIIKINVELYIMKKNMNYKKNLI